MSYLPSSSDSHCMLKTVFNLRVKVLLVNDAFATLKEFSLDDVMLD